MRIHNSVPNSFKPAYGILCDLIFQPSHQIPVGFTLCKIPPGSSTTPHSHQEGEIFFVISGSGLMEIGDTSDNVVANSFVFIPPKSTHTLYNKGTTTLEFLSFYWNTEREFKVAPQSLIAVAPPTPNGPLHLGHLAGPYLAADALSRQLRQLGSHVHFFSGSDDHQSYVPFKAQQLSQHPVDTADFYTTSIQNTFHEYNIELDSFRRPLKDADYQSYVQSFFLRLFETEQIYEKTIDYPFCVSCSRFLHEAYLSGGCPHCHTKTNALGCESCGQFNSGYNLEFPQCNTCLSPVKYRKSKQLFFDIERYRSSLIQYYGSLQLPPRLQALTAQFLQSTLPEVPVSFRSPWGISVPLPTLSDQVIYEWFEMAAGYLFEFDRLIKKGTFKRDIHTEFSLFFGFDNAFFYTCFIPAVFIASQSPVLPKHLITNEFMLLDGFKFSTSRKHAIWAEEFIQDHPSEIVRGFLLKNRPELSQTNFNKDDFDRFLPSSLLMRIHLLKTRLALLQESLPTTTLLSKSLPLYTDSISNDGVFRSVFTPFKSNLAFNLDAITDNLLPEHFSTKQAIQSAEISLVNIDDFLNGECFFQNTESKRFCNAILLTRFLLTELVKRLIPLFPNLENEVPYANS